MILCHQRSFSEETPPSPWADSSDRLNTISVITNLLVIALAIIKYVIPFMLSIIIQLLLYFFFSYLIGHTFTPTQGVFMVSVILSDFFALFFHMIISLSGLFFGNKYLLFSATL